MGGSVAPNVGPTWVLVGDAAGNGGASIDRVVAGSPADKAGLQAGDVERELDDERRVAHPGTHNAHPVSAAAGTGTASP